MKQTKLKNNNLFSELIYPNAQVFFKKSESLIFRLFFIYMNISNPSYFEKHQSDGLFVFNKLVYGWQGEMLYPIMPIYLKFLAAYRDS
jgi:hypothetical protein